jgi:hypothetical protein
MPNEVILNRYWSYLIPARWSSYVNMAHLIDLPMVMFGTRSFLPWFRRTPMFLVVEFENLVRHHLNLSYSLLFDMLYLENGTNSVDRCTLGLYGAKRQKLLTYFLTWLYNQDLVKACLRR